MHTTSAKSLLLLLLVPFLTACGGGGGGGGGGAPLPPEPISLASVANSGAQADAASTYAALSADGRYVVFGSSATNLVAGDNNESWDMFVRDTGDGAGVHRPGCRRCPSWTGRRRHPAR
jgi:hypothetical protein